jgi:hydroxysqualene dehydroxylase
MTPGSSKHPIGIIGAGWSGLAAAVELTRSGHTVTVYESGKIAGGRARRIETGQTILDNGQHLLIGACTETLQLMETVLPGSSQSGFLRLPLTLDYPDGVRLRAPRLPAPLHLVAALLFAHGFSLVEKMTALGFIWSLQKTGFQPNAPRTVGEAIASQPETIRRYLWEPLCLAALNTPVEQASFAVFARVLQDALSGSRTNTDFLIPMRDLTALFPEPAISWIRHRGGSVMLRHRITSISSEKGRWKTSWQGGEAIHDAVVVATAPARASSLLSSLPDCGLYSRQLDQLRYQPIVTTYVEYPVTLTFRTPLLGLVDPVPMFIFDLSATLQSQGRVAAVASAEGPHLDWDDDRWLKEIHACLEQINGPLPAPKLIKRITEKRATFACVPDVIRPPHATPCKGLYLAGDYVDGPYPSTLEGAVRSGVQCALQLMQQS